MLAAILSVSNLLLYVFVRIETIRLRRDIRDLTALFDIHEKTLFYQHTDERGFQTRIRRLESFATTVDGQVARIEELEPRVKALADAEPENERFMADIADRVVKLEEDAGFLDDLDVLRPVTPAPLRFGQLVRVESDRHRGRAVVIHADYLNAVARVACESPAGILIDVPHRHLTPIGTGA